MIPSCSLCADLPTFLSPSHVTDDFLLPDYVLITSNKTTVNDCFSAAALNIQIYIYIHVYI